MDDPVIAQVRFKPPEAKESVTIPKELLYVEKFDMKKRILTLHFSNKNDPDLPASFSLSANKTRAVLSITGKKLRANLIGAFNATTNSHPIRSPATNLSLN